MMTALDHTMTKKLQTILNDYPLVMPIVQAIHDSGGTPFLVGGAVRDLMLGLSVKDLDMEVHGLALSSLEEILTNYGPVSLVGKAYGVLRLHSLDVDWALPRSDAHGRKPLVVIDPAMSIKEAFRRRDLTINAMGIDLVTYTLVDPFNGLKDLQQGVLRAPDEQLFKEDPLRLYRVMQFVGRFGMVPDDQLNSICARMSLDTISVERIQVEFEKLLLSSERPSLGIRWLATIGRLAEIMPEVAATVGIKQDLRWHPEGDVFEHTLQTVDAAARLPKNDDSLTLLYAALCHDLGKITTTREVDGVITSYGHEEAGVELAKSLLTRITRNKGYIAPVQKLVRYHMAPLQFIADGAKPPAYKRLAHKLAPDITMTMLADLSTADRQGRNPQGHIPLQGDVAEVEQFKQKAATCKVLQQSEAPVLLGRDLLNAVEQGPRLGELLERAYVIQVEEGISDKEELKKRVLSN